MAKAVTITKDKFHELLESLQNATATLNQWVREADFPRDAQAFIVKFEVQAAGLFTAVEERVGLLTTQLQQLVAEMNVRETSAEFKNKVRDTIALMRRSDNLLADIAATCRTSLRSLHAASTSVCSQLQLDGRRRQARDEMQRVIQAALDRAHAVREGVEAAAQRAYEAAQKGKEEASRRAHEAADEFRQKTSRKVQAARDAAQKRGEEARAGVVVVADQLRELSPPAYQKVEQALLELQGEGSMPKRAVGAAIQFVGAVVLFLCAVLLALCGKLTSGVEGAAAAPAPKVRIEGVSALSRLEAFLVDKLEPASEHISKVSVEATHKVGHAYAELHSEKPVSARLCGASLEMGRAILLFGCSLVSILCGRVIDHVEPQAEAPPNFVVPAPVPEHNEIISPVPTAPSSQTLGAPSCSTPAAPTAPTAPSSQTLGAPSCSPERSEAPSRAPAAPPVFDSPTSISTSPVEHRVEQVECSELLVKTEEEVHDTKSLGGEAIEQATQAFEEMDRNRDGELSHTEIKRFLREHPDIKKQLGVSDWASFFKRWDVDGDGRIQKDEFLKSWVDAVAEVASEVPSSSPTQP